MDRRTIIKSVVGIGTLGLSGCLSNDTGGGDGVSPSSNEWVKFGVEIDLRRDIEYWFPEKEDHPLRTVYETDKPAEILEIHPYRKGDELEIRGMIRTNEDNIRNIKIRGTKDGSGLDGGPFGASSEVLSLPEIGEHYFTLKSSSTRLDMYDEIKIKITGPTPNEVHGWDEAHSEIKY